MRYLYLLVFMIIPALGFSQVDSAIIGDSISIDSVVIPAKPAETSSLQKLLEENRFLNSANIAESLAVEEHNSRKPEFLFYGLGILLLFFGMLKTFYSRYLSNLVRVFFNTSLRQSQLTDQLLQARLPSLFFNLFFILMGGFFLYFLFRYAGFGKEGDYTLLLWCIIALAIMYSVKYITLKFSGWVTGFSQETDLYIFIIFLINKMLGIILIPVVVVLAFTDPVFTYPVIVIALVVISLMILLRFLRSYSLLGHKIRVSKIHFILYIIGVEVLPVLLILKATGQLLEKS